MPDKKKVMWKDKLKFLTEYIEKNIEKIQFKYHLNIFFWNLNFYWFTSDYSWWTKKLVTFLLLFSPTKGVPYYLNHKSLMQNMKIFDKV